MTMTPESKINVSNNLIAFMDSKEELTKEAADFICDWILTDRAGKCKAHYDVWDKVLKNYMPKTRPVLFRACNRRVDGKIASFTGSIRCAERFSNGKGFLIICDTAETLLRCDLEIPGDYSHTFFPVAELLKKEASFSTCKFPRRLVEDYIKEDEYIMRVNLGWMHTCKWVANG